VSVEDASSNLLQKECVEQFGVKSGRKYKLDFRKLLNE
jgi:hypothetical protein